MMIADTYLSWLPPLSAKWIVLMVLMAVTLWLILRVFWGPSQVHGRIGLWMLRGGSLFILAVILFGPTIVDEQDGEVTRPSMMYLLDGSQSMRLGQDRTRWQESFDFIAEAHRVAGASHSTDCQAFRFGHRLKPLFSPPDADGGQGAGDDHSFTLISSGGSSVGDSSIAPPDATDTRLGDAFRQLLPQVSSKSSAGVVLLSDGRVRASESVERLAEFFGKSNVPVHVVPIGRASGTGDIAVVSLVVPQRVRKYTENELQVFLRSFGFTGQRTTVRVRSKSRIGDASSALLASMPITLSGGAQSVSLTFRVNEQPEDLEIIVDPIEGELTERNNRVNTRVEIDRTKVRVLYVESDASVSQSQSIFSRVFSTATALTRGNADSISVQSALQADEDVECTMLLSVAGSAPRMVNTNQTSSTAGFPKTRAELFAYDCVVFSNLGPDVLEEQQVEWLSQWIEGRGGGMIVAGAKALTAKAWSDTPLEPLLPVTLVDEQTSSALPVDVDISMPQHPVWRLRLEQTLNEELLNLVPPLMASATTYPAKSTAEVLAKRKDDGAPLMMAHRAGRGRVLVSAGALGGNALEVLSNAWGPQPERVAAKFWRNMVYWATEGSATGRRRLVAESDKRFYRPGEPLKVLATAYDEGARRTQKYRVWAMFEPASLDDMSLYSPILWPDGVVRESGEVGPRIAWGEELPLTKSPSGEGYLMNLMLSEASGVDEGGLRVEMTAYEGAESRSAFDHGTQVDSTSLPVQILSDPFEQQNPLPNHDLMKRIAAVSGGDVLEQPSELAELLKNRPETKGPPKRDVSPAWSHWWLWLCLLGLLSSEWVWRRITGLA